MKTFIIFAFLTAVFAWDKDILDRPTPSFIGTLPRQARYSYERIVKNRTATLSEQDSALEQWASQYGVQSQWDDFKSTRSAQEQQLQQNVTNVINQLPNIASQLFDILNTHDMTRQQMITEINALAQQNPQALNGLSEIIETERKISSTRSTYSGSNSNEWD